MITNARVTLLSDVRLPKEMAYKIKKIDRMRAIVRGRVKNEGSV